MSATRLSTDSKSENSNYQFNQTIQDFFIQSTSAYLKNSIEKLCECAKDQTLVETQIPYDYRSIQQKRGPMKTNFEIKLKELFTLIFPSIYKLLKQNKVAGAEQIIMDNLEIYINDSTQKLKSQKEKKTLYKQLKKDQNDCLQIGLCFEKMLLLQMNLQSFKQESQDSSAIDAKESQVQKEKQKVIKQLKKNLQSLQMYFDMKRVEYGDESLLNPESNEIQDYTDPNVKQMETMRSLIIDPFGGKLSVEIIQILTDLDFSDKIIEEAKKVNQLTPRRNARKPQTPVKITKEGIVPLCLNSQFLSSQTAYAQSGKRSDSKCSSIRNSSVQTYVQGINQLSNDYTNDQILGKRFSSFTQQSEASSVIRKMTTTQLNRRQSQMLKTSINSQIPQSLEEQPIIQLYTQSQHCESQNDASSKYIHSSLQSTQFLTNPQKNMKLSSQSVHELVKTSSDKFFDNDPIKHLDSIQMENLSQLQIQTQNDDDFLKRNYNNQGLSTQLSNGNLLPYSQPKQVQHLFRAQSINSSFQSQVQNKKKAMMIQANQPYKTQKPKSKDLMKQNIITTKQIQPIQSSQASSTQNKQPQGSKVSSFILGKIQKAAQESVQQNQITTTQNNNNSSGRSISKNLLQNRSVNSGAGGITNSAFKIKYNRQRLSNTNSKNVTPQAIKEKDAIDEDIIQLLNIQKKLNFAIESSDERSNSQLSIN
eukprot:403340084